ncbi:hypothetical protein EUX98_g1925 [Antrodiella citrinella]|uniref:HSF-type DNA-binding domain-containing protein n=1 Tax=Antrodiella citrinella TaxID=2447956 RepID=A0A4V3XJ96_9APHY|nr:hypothetical protein EUX98_g1925 [Antrodiella citrinella]
MSYIAIEPLPSTSRQDVQSATRHDDTQSTTSEFVRKLYKMLEDTSYDNVVAWGPRGDCFVVKDMNEFATTILPRIFKHSNFASFVRQLNKYDFHKVRNMDDNPFGEHSWTFRHPDFHANDRSSLENIKRKVPTARRSSPPRSYGHESHSPYPPSNPASHQAQITSLQNEIARLESVQDDMALHIRHMEKNYQNVLNEMVDFQRTMARQDQLMQGLIEYFLSPSGNDGGLSSSGNLTVGGSLVGELQVPLTPASLTASILGAQNGSLGTS